MIRPLLRFACLLALLSALPAGSRLYADEQPLLVINTWGLDLPQALTAVSLQGLANSRPEGPRVFVIMDRSDFQWLSYALRLSPRPTREVSLQDLLAALRPYVEGQVLYDPQQPYTLDVATTVAGQQPVVITATDLGLPTALDLRRRWSSATDAYSWALNSLLVGSSHTAAALLPADSAAMRDYAIQQRMFVMSPPADPADPALHEVTLHLAPGATIFGEETPGLLPVLSRASLPFVRAAWSGNLSYYSGIGARERHFQYPGHDEPAADRYLSLIFDCSDLDTALQVMPALWADDARGSLPLGWALPGTLSAAAPPVLHRYLADAYRSGVDQFILGPSGAGEMLFSYAASPDSVYDATRRAAAAMDAHAALYVAPPEQGSSAEAVVRFAGGTGLRGLFLLANYDQPVALPGGIPAVVAPRIDTVEQAIKYLDRIPLDRRFAALILNPYTLTPADAAHIAARVGRRYAVVPPAEMLELVREVGFSAPGEATIAVASATFPQAPPAEDPLPIKVEIEPAASVYSASVVYRAAGSPFAFAEPLVPDGGAFSAELPPLLWGGKVELKVRATDTGGHVVWSPLWEMQVARSDADGDGLSDAEERFLLSDPGRADTDADGLTDSLDMNPATAEAASVWYLGPLFPPADAPYLKGEGGGTADASGRVLKPGEQAVYLLPTSRVPPGTAPVVAVAGVGEAAVSLPAAATEAAKQWQGMIEGEWRSAPVPVVGPAGVALPVTVSCPASASAPLTVSAIALTSPTGAPSIIHVGRAPAWPGPEQPISVSAVAFSPKGLADVSLSYRVNGGAYSATIPMQAEGQRYHAVIAALDDRDTLEYWITARDTEGHRSATMPVSVPIGGRGREVVSLMARRDFVGDWRPFPEWQGAAAGAPTGGAVDVAPVNLTGATYNVWILAGGRGNGIVVSIDGSAVGAIDGGLPDGWQRVGRVRLEAGRHRVAVASQAAAEGEWAAPRYAEVLLSADSGLEPPLDQVLDVHNSLVLLAPNLRDPLHGTIELRATGAGNLVAAEFSVDGGLLRRVAGPPFSVSLPSERYSNGPHTLKVEAVDRAGPTGLALEMPFVIANQGSRE
jgi:hypothetical protein